MSELVYRALCLAGVVGWLVFGWVVSLVRSREPRMINYRMERENSVP